MDYSFYPQSFSTPNQKKFSTGIGFPLFFHRKLEKKKEEEEKELLWESISFGVFLSVVYWNSNLPDNEKSVKQRVLSGERVLENGDLWVDLSFEFLVQFPIWNSDLEWDWESEKIELLEILGSTFSHTSTQVENG